MNDIAPSCHFIANSLKVYDIIHFRTFFKFFSFCRFCQLITHFHYSEVAFHSLYFKN